MGERSYLSIGDVLSLLRDEFPDITISKIRFLESRGLLVPERTPSGYRKFYDHDVERLRWILRQQREHFLPLKVIKGRLEGAETTAESLFDTGEQPPEEVSGPARSALASMSAPNGMTHPSAGRREATQVATIERETEEVYAAAAVTAGAAERAGYVGDEVEAPSPVTAAAAVSTAPASAAPGSAGPASTGPATNPPAPATPAPTPPAPATAPPPEEPAAFSGAAFTASEVASAAALRVEQVEELESFGLIGGRSVAGVHCYDEEAVVVAKLSAEFARYGIEPRHLRIFKHAAERQSGLFAQVVTPLLRQRNPTARARVNDDLVKLAELGSSLQSSFITATLKNLTGR